VRALGVGGAFDVFVSTPDRDGLFAALVAALDRLGLAIQNARVLDAPGGTAFDTFDVLPLPGCDADAAALEEGLARMLAGPLSALRPARRAAPRRLKHFRIATRIGFDASLDGRTVLSLVCTDRPGLLADVTDVLRNQRLRVHDARIATFGERAEDVFQLTDARNRPLDEAARQALASALHTRLDG
jgi:[protein-PII] uridylyltransferase